MASKRQVSFWQKFVSPMVLWNVGGMIVFVLVVLFGTWVWMDKYTHHGENATVPDVEGLNWNTAIERIASIGLTAEVADSTYNESMVPGQVVDQDPKAGRCVKMGRLVRLTVSSNCAPSIQMPDVADNSSRHQAEMKLRAAGFKLGEPERTAGDKDWVYSVKVNGKYVAAGQRVPVNAVITLVVGDGSTNPDYEESDSIYSDDDVINEIIEDLF